MPPPEPADDAMHELRERLAETRRAAERLAGDVPPQGWATPEVARQTHDDVAALAALVTALRELVPPELCGQVNEVLRQVLLLLRAIVDHLVERLEAPDAVADRTPQRDVQDIPLA
jgi:hypothetical protein